MDAGKDSRIAKYTLTSMLCQEWILLSETRIQIAYDGVALQGGEMDVRQLAPALLAIGDLLESSNRTLNGDATKVSVRVRSDFKSGSFEIDFLLVQSLAEQAKMWIAGGRSAVSASDITEFLGLASSVSGLLGLNLIELIRWLNRKRPANVTRGTDGNITLNLEGDGNEIQIHKHVWKLANDEEVRKNLETVLKPLGTPGIDTFEARRDGKPINKITKDEADLFRAPDDEQALTENVQIIVLELISPVFKPDRKWEFSDGDSKITATIDDQKFLQDVEEGHRSFGKGELFRVELLKKQIRKGNKLHTENRIIKVIQHMGRDEQLQMFDEDL